MTCANIGLTILAAVNLFFILVPIGSPGVTKWAIVIASLLIIVIAWTMVECKPCKKK